MVSASHALIDHSPYAPIPADVLERKYHMFRDGRVGQGGSALTAPQRERLRERFAYNPDVDFGRYGL